MIPFKEVLGIILYRHLKKSCRYSLIRALDPALLKSAQLRPDKNPATRAKIEAALKQPEIVELIRKHGGKTSEELK